MRNGCGHQVGSICQRSVLAEGPGRGVQRSTLARTGGVCSKRRVRTLLTKDGNRVCPSFWWTEAWPQRHLSDRDQLAHLAEVEEESTVVAAETMNRALKQKNRIAAQTKAPVRPAADEELLASPQRFLFFTGKGGVGKTSMSCAVAWPWPIKVSESF